MCRNHYLIPEKRISSVSVWLSYVLNLIKDVNGRPSDGGDPSIFMKWMRSAKTAAVGNSTRVAKRQRPEQYKNASRDTLLEDARSEVVAEACETMLTDTDAAKRIGQSLKAKDTTLFEKVKQWFRDLAAKLRRAYKGLNPTAILPSTQKRPSSKWTAWCSCGRIWQWTRRRITGRGLEI